MIVPTSEISARQLLSGAANRSVELQTKVAGHNIDQSNNRRIECRIGVNLGDVIVDGDDIFGAGANVAARLREMANPAAGATANPLTLPDKPSIAVLPFGKPEVLPRAKL
ncbi:MAG: hypothetical protein VCF08_13710 [Alphaproteobacteria bacterium]|jgi:class 3 adenylate cyclase